MGEAWLIGPVIMYDQATGLIWMNQPGEFSVPTETLNRTVSNDPTRPASASSLQWLRPPHCKWNGQLQFDGAVALIEGNIEMNGLVSPEPDRFWQVKGTCQQMEIHLSNPINMQAPKTATANLDRVVLKDSVNIIAAQDDSQGNHLSLEQIAVPILTYHLPNSQIVGAGPGWIRSWHIASSTIGSGGLGQMASSSTERITPKQELQGAHLAFRESMVGYLDKSEVIFEGKVELAVGPLKSWDDLIDLNTMQRLKQDEMLLSSDMLKAYDTSGLGLNVGSASQMQNQGTWEFQALGNVRFAGRTAEGDYSGNGYRVTYTQSKDLLVLEGDGRTPAHIRKDPLPSSREQVLEADVNSAAINVKTMATQDVRITRVAIEAPGTSQPPSGLGPAPTNSNTPIPQRDTKTPDPRSPAWLRPRE